VPIHLMILTSLRYLGRGWTFDDCEEATAVSEDVCCVFFHEFIHFGQNFLYPKYVWLHNPALSCNFDSSSMGQGEDFYDKRRARQLHFEPQDGVAQVIAQLDGVVTGTKPDYGTILQKTCQTLQHSFCTPRNCLAI
jgi:hypothetical protein